MKIFSVLSTSIDSFKRLVIKMYNKGSDTRTAKQVGSYGVDSNPIPGMIALYTKTELDGNEYCIGYLNKNCLADVGEHRTYSTDTNGLVKTYIWLKNDGTIEFAGNTNHLTRYEDLKTGFDQLKSDHNALVQKWNAFCSAYTPGSPATVGTPPTLSASTVTASAADISNSKINQFKTL